MTNRGPSTSPSEKRRNDTENRTMTTPRPGDRIYVKAISSSGEVWNRAKLIMRTKGDTATVEYCDPSRTRETVRVENIKARA